jgi:hypothetical protein
VKKRTAAIFACLTIAWSFAPARASCESGTSADYADIVSVMFERRGCDEHIITACSGSRTSPCRIGLSDSIPAVLRFTSSSVRRMDRCTLVEENPGIPRCYMSDRFGLIFNLTKRVS